MAKHKSKVSPFASQVAAEALIRYNPELSGLKELQRQAQDTYTQRVHAGNATSAALRSVIDSAVPDVRQAYSDGATGIGDVNALVKGDVAGLQGSGAERFRNALTTETANFANLLKGARANALTDLSRRKVSAASGAKFSADQAGSDLASSLEKIGLRMSDIGKETGAFQQQRIGELTTEQGKQSFTAHQNALTRRTRRLAAGVDATGKVIPGGKADKPGKKKPAVLPGGTPLATPVVHSKARDAISEAGTWITRLTASQHMNEQTIKDRLVAGDTLVDASGNKLKLPKIPKDLVQAAWDVWHSGGVSHSTAMALHGRGLSVKQLGLPRVTSKSRADKLASRALQQTSALVAPLGK